MKPRTDEELDLLDESRRLKRWQNWLRADARACGDPGPQFDPETGELENPEDLGL